jgi:hypothetical protein
MKFMDQYGLLREEILNGGYLGEEMWIKITEFGTFGWARWLFALCTQHYLPFPPFFSFLTENLF